MRIMKPITPFAFIGAALATTSLAQAHFDIRPRVETAQIVTDGYEDASATTAPGLRVFGYDFGENADDPFFAQDPGFNAISGSGLPQGSQFTFNILGGLEFWDGSGAPSFAPVGTGESIDLNFGAVTRTIAGSSTNQAGFNIQAVGAGGTIHRHLNAFLKGSDGNTVPAGPGSWGAGDGIQAADGIYLFSLELLLDPSGGIGKSEPIFLVFNNGLPEAAHDLAIDWAQTNRVPEPAVAGLLGIVVLASLRRR